MTTPTYSIHKCEIGNHLFNVEKGFILVRVFNPQNKYEETDTWFCLKHAEEIGKHVVKF